MEINFYSTHCPKCKVLETKLKQKGLFYTEINDIDAMLAKGLHSVPYLEIDGKLLNFTEANTWLNELGDQYEN